MDLQKIRLIVNGKPIEREIECRQNLADFLRHELALTGTHVGCEHGVCGSCTVQHNGAPVRSCLMLAVQADGSEITTVEGLASGIPSDRCSKLSKNITRSSAVFARRDF